MKTPTLVFAPERCATVQLLGRRHEQQDTCGFVIREAGNGIDCFVADGHADEGRSVAEHVAEVFSADSDDHDLPDERIQETFHRIHREVSDRWWDGGATVTWIGIRGTALTAAWCGDSEARLVKQDGHLTTLTIPHHYGVHRAETIRLDREEVLIGNGQGSFERRRRWPLIYRHGYLAISRTIGDAGFAPARHEPEIIRSTITPQDRFLIVASDGLWGPVTRRGSNRHRLEEILRDAVDAADAKQRLEALLGRWKLHDNTTVLIVELFAKQ